MKYSIANAQILDDRCALGAKIRVVSSYTLLGLLVLYELLWLAQASESSRWTIWNSPEEYGLTTLSYIFGYHLVNLVWPIVFILAPWNKISKLIDPRAIIFLSLPGWIMLVGSHMFAELYRSFKLHDAGLSLGEQVLVDLVVQTGALVVSMALVPLFIIVSLTSKKWGRLQPQNEVT